LLLTLCQLTAAGEPTGPLVFREGLVLPRVGRYGRSVVHTDAVEAHLVTGRWKRPEAGDRVPVADGPPRTWEKAVAGKDGWLRHSALQGGYALWLVPRAEAGVLLLEASGHALVYVNGEPRTGDVYDTGFVRLPVLLRRGTNELLFHCARGRVRARLVEPRGKALFNPDDALYPDLIAGEDRDSWGSVVVLNASAEALAGLTLQAQGEHLATTATPIPPLPPLGIRKVAFRLRGAAPEGTKEVEAQLTLRQGGGVAADPLAQVKARLRVRRPSESHTRTFLSAIDGSVQYYAVNPAQPLTKDAPPPALFLSLHGAGVQATGQADAYEAKTWGHLVAPTNRRPFGFDWEDWGRLDALEVLERARQELHTDPARTYLTGHSMGGHGVWHLGVTYPDRFAAVGPSAGWPTFAGYVTGKRAEPDSPAGKLVQRATNPGDTLALAPNLAPVGVYILHGGADDNVPVAQARLMRDLLGRFHRDFVYHEQPKAGHWWDASDEPGVDCVDWAPMFDFFARHVIPRHEGVREVSFLTACPGVSARSRWLTIEAQQKQLQLSGVTLRFDPGLRRFAGTTDNVARLALDLGHVRPGSPLRVELDGQKLKDIPWPAGERTLWLARQADKWSVVGRPPAAHKGPHRYGPFRDAFRHHVQFVYGTKGTDAEKAWALAKARFDAETFWYRGNGSVDVIPDAAFDPTKEPGRGVVLYGSADTNGAWGALLGDSPVQVRRGEVAVGTRRLKGEDLACLFLRPRPGSDRACVAVVAGSGLVGMRLADRLPLFVSGVGYPDCLVLGAELLTEGSGGVRLAGYFGLDWSVTAGEFAGRE
jgi:poly(3-hydroxybutyrate) depolymerase